MVLDACNMSNTEHDEKGEFMIKELDKWQLMKAGFEWITGCNWWMMITPETDDEVEEITSHCLY